VIHVPSSIVAIERAAYEAASIQAAVNDALTAIGAEEILQGKRTVLLKPNLLSPTAPQNGITTKPEVLGAVIDWLLEHGITAEDVVVAESSSGMGSDVTKRAFKKCGLQDMCEAKGVRWTPFEGTPMVKVDLPDGKKLDHVYISEELANADLVINLPMIKTHGQMVLTVAIKNMFGSLPLMNKPMMHSKFPAFPDFAEMLVDVYSASKPGLTVVDGITGIEGDGPGAAGKLVKDLGLILASIDPVAIDTICAEIMGIDQARVLPTQAAAARGLGTNVLEEIQIVGVPLAEARHPFKLPKHSSQFMSLFNSRIGHMFAGLMGRFVQVRAWYDKKCISCGKCVEICPGKALEIRQKGARPTWTKAKCINCHCCEEVCPQGAAHVSIAGIRGIFSRPTAQ
jgi:uncharacterized protein (DUF362 family)/ferredoxin